MCSCLTLYTCTTGGIMVQLFDPIHMYYWRDYGAAV